jgi:hypothetical protein
MVEDYNLVDLFQLGDLTSFFEDIKMTLQTGENLFLPDKMVKNYTEIYQA